MPIQMQKRPVIEFQAPLMAQAEMALIDLTDPLKTNVRFIMPDGDMYADFVKIQNMQADPSGVARTLRQAWEDAFTNRLKGSNHVALVDPGILHIQLWSKAPPIPRPNIMN